MDEKRRDFMIGALLAGFPATSGGQMALEAYRLAVSDYQIGVIEQAVRNYITGRVEGHNKAFAPSVAELSSECSRIHAKAFHEERKKQREAEQLQMAIEDNSPERIAMRERIGAKLKELAQSLSTD